MRPIVPMLVVGALLTASCGSGDDRVAEATVPPADPSGTVTTTTSPPTTPSPPATSPPTTSPATSPPTTSPIGLPERVPSSADRSIAGSSVSGFGFDLMDAASRQSEPADNVVISPLSVAIALALLEPGASGAGRDQLHDLLRIGDAADWHASLSALEHALEAADANSYFGELGDDQDPGELAIDIADAAFVQPGYAFRDDYLATIGTTYGAAIEPLDFATDQQAAADRINSFVSDATDGHIRDLVSADAISPDTVLALVNALLLQASWMSTFDVDRTVDEPFHRLDGTDVTVPSMMDTSGRSGDGDGWVAATKRLVGGLEVEFYLPDDGRFDDVAGHFAEVVAEFATSTNPGGVLVVPRFETRVNTDLGPVLTDLGLTAIFERGNLMGIADDERLVLDQALHQAWISIDEDGVEAAAATLLVAVATSEPADPPIDVVLDRPFLFRIVHRDSGATLFVGRIMDPTT